MNSFYVYVIQEQKASRTAPIKIGVSSNIDRRLLCLQTYNPRALEIKLRFGPMGRAAAYGFESHLQHELKPYHLRGEWYSGKALKLICNPSRSVAA